AVLVRRQDERPLHGRRRPGRVGGGRLRAERTVASQLRLEPLRGECPVRERGARTRLAVRAAGARVPPRRRRLLCHGRLRVPRRRRGERARPLLLRRLLQRARLEPASRRREGGAGPPPGGRRACALVLRRGRARRALPRLAGRAGLPARGLTRPAPPHLRPFAAERGVRQRLERLVQVAQLVRDHGQLLARLLAAVEAGELLRDPVEPLEQRLEPAVGELSVLHAYEASSASQRTTRAPG